ncbi:hypothetical protein J421_5746 (plasmid) [Gemmatirosa kalamazoonensis]|uniref:Lipid/polyisoprenoid-binding YceI-like domain-containing protein n=1 Tax=Gemmatirosa kalamazoonensis TaxID=861299 RepID=W0RRH0_9BACT|nr:YceI family protein [Gemmatirosa kalamazoonensis]AHG93281.1 hypothetical protein J421_5746 [Gemmatirosa kalamazoonensis]
MRTTPHTKLFALLCLTPAVIAWRSAAEPLRLAPQSRLWIDGTSTVKKFSCTAPAFTVDVDAAPGASAAVLAGTKAVHTAVVRVSAAKMDCGNGTMNEHMLKALKANEAPTIEFRLTGYDVATSGAGAAGTLNGTLSVGGAQHTIAIATQAVAAGDGALRVTGSYALHMKEFALKPPTLMLGAMKVGELITVRFDLVLKGAMVVAARPVPIASPAPRAAPPAPVTVPAAPAASAVSPARGPASPVKPAVRATAPAATTVSPGVRDRADPVVLIPQVATPALVPTVSDTTTVVAIVRDSSAGEPVPADVPAATTAAPSNVPPITIQRLRPADQRGINVFEAPKNDTMPFTGFRLAFGAAFTQQFQGLGHSNTAAANVVNGVNANQLITIGHGFNNASANAYVNVQLAKGVRVALTSYLSSRHHNEVWIKDGYALIDASPVDFEPLNRLMRYVTLKAGHFEINYGDAHFRRTDNGNAMFNPLVGNYIMDAFTTEVGGEAYVHGRGLLDGAFVMGAVTNGEVRGTILNPGKRAPAFYGKLGVDRQVSEALRVRLTGSLFSQSRANAQTLYNGDRGGSRYYDVLENTASTESAQAWSGAIQPFNGQSTGQHSVVVNPFVKYHGLEYFGTFERARADAARRRRRTARSPSSRTS